MPIDAGDLQAVAEELRNVADEIRTLGQEQEDRISNMPDSLQDSDSAQLLRGRTEACENLAGELEDAADKIENIDPSDEAREKREAAYDPDPEGLIVSQVADILSDIN